ncbi:uncharacterized protein N7446_004570 [Penicillium canescens]|uniref:Uncharacterized protein n=1 Tax=Penicillium canescens TaxID=5083 RepID=A0AAD6N367_PENCN|nr:uncharacterized protein N7446_004570 [Penicillium canescens]KAJ6026830.1 hypothetical protein N7460_011647 [Penicillium canescens]KAJ6067533.1 hypothetical protein N7446_004570 [Penicillium canescens]
MNSTRGHFQPSVNNPPQSGMSESNIKDFMQAAQAVSGAYLELSKCVDALAKVMGKTASKTMASGTMTSGTSATGPERNTPMDGKGLEVGLSRTGGTGQSEISHRPVSASSSMGDPHMPKVCVRCFRLWKTCIQDGEEDPPDCISFSSSRSEKIPVLLRASQTVAFWQTRQLTNEDPYAVNEHIDRTKGENGFPYGPRGFPYDGAMQAV